MSNSSSRVEPKPEVLYKSDDTDTGDGRAPSPMADGSQEEAEKEDTVGLFSNGPSRMQASREYGPAGEWATGGVCKWAAAGGYGKAALFRKSARS